MLKQKVYAVIDDRDSTVESVFELKDNAFRRMDELIDKHNSHQFHVQSVNLYD